MAPDRLSDQTREIHIAINPAWCKGCYLCVATCPREVLDIDRDRWTGSYHAVYVRQIEQCTACRNCELLCPDMAIEVIVGAGDGDTGQ